ncbi:MAG: hypothetical protein Rhims3KO_06900 [Hyphomicrobiales bacterium]
MMSAEEEVAARSMVFKFRDMDRVSMARSLGEGGQGTSGQYGGDFESAAEM